MKMSLWEPDENVAKYLIKATSEGGIFYSCRAALMSEMMRPAAENEHINMKDFYLLPHNKNILFAKIQTKEIPLKKCLIIRRNQIFEQ